MNRESRVCFFDTPTSVVHQGEATFVVDPELLIALLPEGNNLLDSLAEFRGPHHREVCFVPLVSPAVGELMSQEIDAKEYQVGTREISRRRLLAFREIRGERCRIESEGRARIAAERRKAGRG